MSAWFVNRAPGRLRKVAVVMRALLGASVPILRWAVMALPALRVSSAALRLQPVRNALQVVSTNSKCALRVTVYAMRADMELEEA